jgi:Flp pilus assembly protein TadD
MLFDSVRRKVAFKSGTMLLRKAQWRPAAFLLGRAAKLGPEDWESHNNLAVALLKLERWEEAAEVAQRAIVLDPTAVDSHAFLAIALLQLERWEGAVAACQRAITVAPDRYDSYDRLGMALWRLERWEEVVATCEAALKLDASHHAVHQRLGIALLRLGQWDAAAAAFRRAIALASNDPAAAAEFAGLQIHLANAEAQRDSREESRLDASAESMRKRFEHRRAAFWTEENLGTDVFAVERWLEQLSVVPDQAAVTPGPRLLFVLDNDFGELATVKFFVLGQALAGRATLLLPERLYVHNADAIHGRTHRYGSVEDILEAVDREQSEIVFLCSAYLFWDHLAFTKEDLGRLSDALQDRGCRVVTTDPFVGRLSTHDPRTLISFELPIEHALRLVAQKYGSAVANDPETITKVVTSRRVAEERTWAAYMESERILRDKYHLYPSFCDVAEHDRAETDARNISFFNDRLLRPAPAPEGAGTPHWLFILATTDCDIQSTFEGEAFFDIVASKLVETLAAARHPILIGPKAFVDALVPRMPTAEGIDILSHCPFAQFMSLLLSAEHAFYWNVLSHSLLIRLYNRLPIVAFDRGHLVRSAPAIYDRIVGWYYQGAEPPLRDDREPLTLETVEGWATDYRQQADRLVERYRRAPSPEQVIANLMGRPVNETSLPRHSTHGERSTPE